MTRLHTASHLVLALLILGGGSAYGQSHGHQDKSRGSSEKGSSRAAEHLERSSRAVTRRFVTIDVPDAAGTVATGINDRNQVVGWYQLTDGVTHGFLFDRGIFTTIDPPLSTSTIPRGINKRGQIVGSYSDSDDNPHGFLFDHGTFTIIDAPRATITTPFAINDKGQIVGQYGDLSGTHGFLFDREGFTTIDAPDATATALRGINNRGQIVGRYLTTGDVDHFFVLDNGVFTPIEGPGGATRLVDLGGVNDSGQIVGETIEFPPNAPAIISDFLLDNGTYVTIRVLGAREALAAGINNQGQIVGQYGIPGQHGFVY